LSHGRFFRKRFPISHGDSSYVQYPQLVNTKKKKEQPKLLLSMAGEKFAMVWVTTFSMAKLSSCQRVYATLSTFV